MNVFVALIQIIQLGRAYNYSLSENSTENQREQTQTQVQSTPAAVTHKK